ncbi:MAG: ATP-binding protein, partial [Anaerolineales bacterium]
MVAQYLGDGALVFFGAPSTHEDDPQRAVYAALDLQNRMLEFQHELEGIVDSLQLRIGINSGEVVLGNLGTESHSEYLALGDAVNLASRLQSAADPGQVLISESVRRQVAHAFLLEDAGEFELKGISSPVSAARVLGPKQEFHPARGLASTKTLFVGREVELDRLVGVLQSLLQGQGRIVALLGEAGIGKTRLLEEARQRLLEADLEQTEYIFAPGQIQWLEGRALSYGESLSNWVITQLLLDDLGLTDGAPELRIKVALRKRVEELFGAEGEENWPYLAHLFDLKLSGIAADELAALEGESRRHQTKVVLRRYFEHAARQQPLALVLEDLHWADPSSLDVLEQLLGLTDRVPMLILALMRVDHDHGSWNVTNKARTDFPHRYEEIYLRRLLAVDTAELLTGLMGAGSFPQELRELILSRAEGNPFYLEEVVRHLQENNLLTLVDGEWTLSSELDALGIPDTLQGVLLARIDRLEGAVRETLQLAAVIGRSFLYRILASISEAERQLDEHLTELQRGELVREKTRLPELEYVFKHALTQEAAYGSLLHERRKRFHLLVGEAIEKLFPDRQEEYLGLLAYHFEKGEQPGKAAPYLVRAGDHARMEDLLPEAEAYYQRAIGCLKVLGQGEGLAQTTMKLALVYQARSMFDAAHRTYSEAF